MASKQKNPLRHNGKVYDLTITDLARIAGRSVRWAYTHQDRLGGVKRSWDGTQRQQIRFPSVGLKGTLKAMGVKPVGEIAHVES